MGKIKKKLKYGTFKDYLLIIIMTMLIGIFGLFIFFCAYIVISAPEISEDNLYKRNSTVLYAKDGVTEIARLGVENRETVTYEQLPEVLVDAIVATEDSRFFQHNGVDLARFSKAVIGQILGHSDAGGGSTLTMQVSKNAATSTASSGIKGIIRKFTDIYLSVFVFEKRYTKEEIMEFYVNIPFLGSHAYGVEQASQKYFGKSVSELNLAEAATIAGLFQAPSSYDPYVYPENATERRNTVLNLMYRHGYITSEERDAAKAVPIESMLVGNTSLKNKYQGFIDTVVEEVIERTKTKANPKGDDPYVVPMAIYTTMIPEKQDAVNDVMNGVTYTWKSDYAQAGIAVIDVKDGSITAIGNGRNMPERGFNYATSASRHPGSTAKPVIDYGPAIEYLDWSTGQTIVDDEYSYTGGGQIKNWDNKFNEITTIKTALARSRNIPALITFQQTTNEQKVEFSKGLGWDVEDDGNGHLLESSSIGGFEGVTPLQSAAAYAAFGRGGDFIEPYSFTKLIYSETDEEFKVSPERKTVMSPETAYMITMMLKYAVTSGNVTTGSISGTDIAGKTGTSTVDSAFLQALGLRGDKVSGDSWENAYSPDYSITMWYGYPKMDKENYLGSNEASAERRKITSALVKGIMEKNSKFKQPKGIETAEIELETDPLELASPFTPEALRSNEYFKKGTKPTTTSTRFSQLNNPTNLSYRSTDLSVTISWSPVATPDAADPVKLAEFFNNSTVYKPWAEKYYNKRLAYNNDVFGAFGYRVYLKTDNGLSELGFTTNTSFTTNISISSTSTFVVKSSYQKFPANASSGAQINVAANSSGGNTPEIPANAKFTAEFLGNTCLSLDQFKALGNKKIKVTSNNTDVTSSSTISESCETSDGNDIECSQMTAGKEYNVTFSVKYGAASPRNISVSIKDNC